MEATVKRKFKMEDSPLPSVAVSRFTMTDFPAYAPWLFARLKEEWPNLTEQMIAGWLRGRMESNEFCVVKTALAVGLAELVHRPLATEADVMVVFVYPQDDSQEASLEAAAIYRQFAQWAKTLRSRDLTIDDNPEIPLGLIEKACGQIHIRRTRYIVVSDPTG